MNRFTTLLLAATLCLIAPSSQADDLIMVRSPQDFPETMLALQEAIKAEGYHIARVQRVDIGLTRRGFQTDKYRVVFFGRNEEIARLLKQQPELAPYLPLKISIFAEGEETLVVTMNPLLLSEFYPDSPAHEVFQRWALDVQRILTRIRTTQ
ncbi:MAG TPA: DUF302 domain-containing protein [Gammaproteobacteria bacterium]|nr:DUF302 domain-containing protein [Gammaproteobacteria bacterium]